MRNIAIILIGSFLVASCGTPVPPEPSVVTKDVNMPVAVSCVPKTLGPPPTYPDTADAAKAIPFPGADAALAKNPADVPALKDELSNIYFVLQLYAKGRLLRIQREKEQTAALQACK